MASYRIVCTVQEPVARPKDQQHIVEVGVGDDPNQAANMLKLERVIAMLDSGDTFYTIGPNTRKRAEVKDYMCLVCNRRIIKSGPDATTDNNLDGAIRYCRLKAA